MAEYLSSKLPSGYTSSYYNVSVFSFQSLACII